MRVLVVGSGAREHAIMWRLQRGDTYCAAPGNAGTALLGENLPVSATDIEGLVVAAKRHKVDLVIVGPDRPLGMGLANKLRKAGIPVCGPSGEAAQLEADKVWAKELMFGAGIPTAPAVFFDDPDKARLYVQQRELPFVVKVRGYAEGKGVRLCYNREAALKAVEDFMEKKIHGESGRVILVEEMLEGREVSVFVFVNGTYYSSSVEACDYKPLFPGGPNTGGMGGYSPPEFWDSELERVVKEHLLEPTLRELARRGIEYRGVLYLGLMLTKQGPVVLEYNTRLGDPEAQLILPRLKGNFLEICQATAGGELERVPVRWDSELCTVGIVVASEGYPDSPVTGREIFVPRLGTPGIHFFYAGIERKGRKLCTTGGRVLTVVAEDSSLGRARVRAYWARAGGHSSRGVELEGQQYRNDIASHVW